MFFYDLIISYYCILCELHYFCLFPATGSKNGVRSCYTQVILRESQLLHFLLKHFNQSIFTADSTKHVAQQGEQGHMPGEKKVLSHLVWKLFKIFSLIVRVSLESREPFTPSRLLNMAQTWYVQISFCRFDLALKGGRSESREGRHHAPRSARLQHCGRGNESCPGKNSFHCKFLFLSR